MMGGNKKSQQKFILTRIATNLNRRLWAVLPCMLLILPFSTVQADDLAQIFELAANNDPEIRQARANYNASHTTIDQGRSFLLPRVTVGGSTSRDTAGPAVETPFGQPHSFQNGFNTKGYNLSINQALLNFEAWYAFKAAKKY